MRKEDILKWVQEVEFGEPPPMQPPFDNYGEPIYDGNDIPAIYPDEKLRDFQDREILEKYTTKGHADMVTLVDSVRQIKLLSRAGADKGLLHPPKLLPAVASTGSPSSTAVEESYTSDRHSQRTYVERVRDIGYPEALCPLAKVPVQIEDIDCAGSEGAKAQNSEEPKPIKFEGIDCTGSKVAKAQRAGSGSSSHSPPELAKKYYRSKFKEHLDPDEPLTPYPYVTDYPKAGSDVIRCNAVRKFSDLFSGHFTGRYQHR
jgi:hypothetical protein